MSKLKNLVICFSGNFGSDRTDRENKRWTESNGALFQTNVNRDTTHLIASQRDWENKSAHVRAAEKHGAKIVNYEWFDDRLRSKGRVSEVKYLWSRIDEATSKRLLQKAKLEDREKKAEVKRAEKAKKESERINWGGALLEHTGALAATHEDEEESQLAIEFKKGALDAKQDLMSDNHHVYMDHTGFRYDVHVTKIHLGLSREAKAIITIYETNSTPSNYTTVVKYRGTKIYQESQIKTCHGTNYATAFRAFRLSFLELTGVEWDNRILAFAPTKTPELDQPMVNWFQKASTAKTPTAKVKGKGKAKITAPPPESPEPIAKREAKEFAVMKYKYHIPGPGEPVGAMPDPEHLATIPQISVYEKFGRVADAAVKKRERFLANKKKSMIKKKREIITIESSDEESSGEEDEVDDAMQGLLAPTVQAPITISEDESEDGREAPKDEDSSSSSEDASDNSDSEDENEDTEQAISSSSQTPITIDSESESGSEDEEEEAFEDAQPYQNTNDGDADEDMNLSIDAMHQALVAENDDGALTLPSSSRPNIGSQNFDTGITALDVGLGNAALGNAGLGNGNSYQTTPSWSSDSGRCSYTGLHQQNLYY